MFKGEASFCGIYYICNFSSLICKFVLSSYYIGRHLAYIVSIAILVASPMRYFIA